VAAIVKVDRRIATGAEGFSLMEVMVSAFLLLIVFFGLAQVYARGRTQLNFEEDRRKATAVLQARVDGIRRDYAYDDLSLLAGTDTTYVVENHNFVVSHAVSDADPEAQATTVTLQVSWIARTPGGAVTRTEDCSTILGRGMPLW